MSQDAKSARGGPVTFPTGSRNVDPGLQRRIALSSDVDTRTEAAIRAMGEYDCTGGMPWEEVVPIVLDAADEASREVLTLLAARYGWTLIADPDRPVRSIHGAIAAQILNAVARGTT